MGQTATGPVAIGDVAGSKDTVCCSSLENSGSKRFQGSDGLAFGSAGRSGRLEDVWVQGNVFHGGMATIPSSVDNPQLVLVRDRVFFPHLHSKFEDFYEVKRQIGEGSYGHVYEATARAVKRTAGRPMAVGSPFADLQFADLGKSAASKPRGVAVKAFPLDGPCKDGEGSERHVRELAGRRTSFEVERSILSKLEHPHIVKMYECFEEKSSLYIVLELCRGGELYERIAQRARSQGGGGLEEHIAQKIFRQMLYAVSYLHANQVVHRDIKTENFLLLGELGSADADLIKLCDFGTAVHLNEHKLRSMERIGTLSYTAPEIYANKGANTTADAWSLGATLYVILVGASPFRSSMNETREETLRKIQVAQFDRVRPAWQNVSEDAKDLVAKFLVVDESRRLVSKGGLRHRWMERAMNGAASGWPKVLSPRTLSSPRVVPASPRGSGGGDLTSYAEHAPVVVDLLVRFMHLDPMEQIILTLVAQMNSEGDLIHCRSPVPWYDLFFALDENEDGRLSFMEFVKGMKILLRNCSDSSNFARSVQEDQLFSLAQTLDIDQSGHLEWIELVALALLAIPGIAEEPEPLSTAFRLLDRPSGDGTVGAADLLAVFNFPGSSNQGSREHVLQLLSRWAPRREKQRYSDMSSPPSLTLLDVKRVLESVTRDMDDAGQVRDWAARDRDYAPATGGGWGSWADSWSCPMSGAATGIASPWSLCATPRTDDHSGEEMQVTLVEQRRTFSRP